jgi:hypothetical protein
MYHQNYTQQWEQYGYQYQGEQQGQAVQGMSMYQQSQQDYQLHQSLQPIYYSSQPQIPLMQPTYTLSHQPQEQYLQPMYYFGQPPEVQSYWNPVHQPNQGFAYDQQENQQAGSQVGFQYHGRVPEQASGMASGGVPRGIVDGPGQDNGYSQFHRKKKKETERKPLSRDA